MTKKYYVDIIDAGDGSDDVILQLPDDLILDMGWKPGTILIVTGKQIGRAHV